jgi:hypothetical protein
MIEVKMPIRDFDIKNRKIYFFTISICFFFLTVPLSSSIEASSADTSQFFFYKPYGYGSQAAFNPLNVVINGGYGIWQIATQLSDRRIFKLDYYNSSRYLWDDIKDPVKTVHQFGAKRFFLTEVIPSSWDVNNQQYFPNYGLHLIGAGMLSRKTEEWFHYYGVPGARYWSIATMIAYHYLSEMIEFGAYPHLTVDPIADLYIFDPLGILLFMNNGVCQFFSEKVHMAEWSLQPAYNFRTGNLENMGQFYIYKFPFTRDHRWSLFGRSGLHEMAGFSRMIRENGCISVAFGAGVENIVRSNQEGPGLSQTASWMWSAAAFYDIKNSLVASLTMTGMPQDRMKINIYPGLLRVGAFSPGLFFAWSHEAVIGINMRYCPLGASVGSARN